jgi:YVTN family beta-propeller protein
VSTDSRIGTEIAGYRIESVLGRGGMGVVYVARHLRLDRTVALKVVSPELAEDPKFRDRFIRESRLAASLEHPNIVPIHDAGEADGILYLAMRLVQGTDLKSLIAEEGGLDPGRTVRLLEQAAGALDAAHQAGLVHRDVKPGNVLVASPGTSGEHAYLSDFGLTKRMTSDSGLTGTGQFVGTLDYAAPEQFEGKQLDGRADVYSLACVLYESLTGEIPFRRDNQAALVYAHLMADPPKVTAAKPELPEAIDAVVAKGMAKKPEDRYGTAGALVDDARGALGEAAFAGGRTTAPLTKATAPPGGPRRFVATPARIAVAAGLVVAVVIGTILLLNRGGGGVGPGPTTSAGSSPNAALASKDRVVRINPATKQVVTSIAAGKAPSGLALGEGSVWVANSGDDSVSRIDPVANKVTGVIPVGRNPSAISFGEGSIWVANVLGNSVSRIDPANNEVTATIRLDGNPSSIAAGGGGVLVASALEIIAAEPFPSVVVWRIDPGTNAVTATSHIVGVCQGLVALDEGGAWVTTGQYLARVDPATGEVKSEFNPGVTLQALTVGEGSVWSATLGLPARVLRFDAGGKRVEEEIPVGNSRPRPAATSCPILPLAVGNGVLWVTNLDDGSISQIATLSNFVVDSFPVGKGVTGLALGQGGLWASVDVP